MKYLAVGFMLFFLLLCLFSPGLIMANAKNSLPAYQEIDPYTAFVFPDDNGELILVIGNNEFFAPPEIRKGCYHLTYPINQERQGWIDWYGETCPIELIK